MRVFFVNRFFYPDHSATSQMLADLAFGLAARGHAIIVVTSRLDYEHPARRLAKQETICKVEVIRTSTSGFGRHGLVGRMVDYLTFYLSALWQLLRHVRGGDLVIAMTDPPLLSIIAAPAAWIRGARAGNWLQDIFPEVAIALGMKRGRVLEGCFWLLQQARNASLRSGVLTVVIGEHMGTFVRRLGVRLDAIRVIPNWADGQLVVPVEPQKSALRRAWGLNCAFVVGYSGNLGRAHDHETILGAMRLLARRDCETSSAAVTVEQDNSTRTSGDIRRSELIHWLFVGGGVGMEKLKEDVRSHSFANVQFRSYQSRDNLAESLSLPDVHLISLRAELEGLIVPSKYYGIAAAGRPAIFIGDPEGEIGQLLTKTQTGFVVAQGDSEALVHTILMLAQSPRLSADFGRRARSHFERAHDVRFAIAAWEEAILSHDAGKPRAHCRSRFSSQDPPSTPKP